MVLAVRLGADVPCRLDAVHLGHPHVHQHDLGRVLAHEPYRVPPVGGTGDDGDVGLRLEQRREPGAHDLLVVDDERPDHAGAPASSGSIASTANPAPSAAPHENDPPAMVARSRIPTSPCPATGSPERNSICAVLDEYCMFNGVVTVEDILEEIVGEIWDEDDPPSGIRQLADGWVVCRGDTSLLDLEP